MLKDITGKLDRYMPAFKRIGFEAILKEMDSRIVVSEGAVGPQGPAGADGAPGADGAVGPVGPAGLSVVPATAASTGTAGEVAIDADFIYVCTDTDTWVRTAIVTATW